MRISERSSARMSPASSVASSPSRLAMSHRNWRRLGSTLHEIFAPGRWRGLLAFREPFGNQLGQRLHDLGGLWAARLDRDAGAGPGREHHQAHDRGAADPLGSTSDEHLCIELLHRHDKLGGGAGVQAALVADFQYATDGGRGPCGIGTGVRLAHLPFSPRLATVMYLRPASCAAITASCNGQSSRTLSSLTSIGKFIPASTSTCGRPITEIERLDGVPPNMSVRMATPSPLSTRFTASMMSRRRCSGSSSGPMVTASICCWGPTTCSSAERNSTASRPWVTRTKPIIELPAGAMRRTKGPPSSRSEVRAQGVVLLFLRPCCIAVSGALAAARQGA